MAEDNLIKKHWIVCGFSPDETGESIGSAGSTSGLPFATEAEAKQKARELAAGAPYHYFVVYEATWYAFTAITPVSLLRIRGVTL